MTLEELKRAAKDDIPVSEETASFNQFDLPELLDGRVFLTKEVFNKMISLGNMVQYTKSNSQEFVNNREDGTFFYGTEFDPGQIFLNSFSTFDDYDKSERSFKLSTRMQNEYFNKIDDSSTNVIVHFHTHPPVNSLWRRFSDCDLKGLAKLQIHNQPRNSEKKVLYLACLFTKGKQAMDVELSGFEKDNLSYPFNSIDSVGNDVDDQLSFVFYDANKNELYKISNIYVYVDKNDVRKVDLLTTEVKDYYKNGIGEKSR